MNINNKKKSKKKWFIIGAAAAVLIVIVVVNLTKSDESIRQVTAGEVKLGDITSIVTASGKIQARTEVKISANVSAKIVDLPVKEGQPVSAGQLLVQLDPDRYQAAADQYRASLASQEAQAELSRAQMEEARLTFERAEKLHKGKLISDEAYDAVRTQFDVQKATHNAALHAVDRAKASLREARNQLDYTTIVSPIDGIITALNAEIGEIVMIGTMNNAGTVIMTVSDLAEIEAEVEVDETDIASVAVGQEVKVELDALPDTTFRGVVTEVGNSAQFSGYGTSDQVINFIVTILLQETVPDIRPGMSATCDITTARAEHVAKVPIGAVVLRDEKDIREQQQAAEGGGKTDGAVASETDSTNEADADTVDEDEKDKRELQGVFIIRDGKAFFAEVVTGIADQQNIHIVSGVDKGDQIVTGSFKTLRELNHGDRVEVKKSPTSEEK
jgi:HlyD family secretion protein